MMKTILVTTDFSAPSQTAAHFAMYLANKMKARVALCHAIQMSPAITVAAQVSGGLENYSTIKDAADEQIRFQVLSLATDEEQNAVGGTLAIDCIVAPGPVTYL